MAASRLNINLQALTANYHYLDQCSSSATQTGAAVKADAYGLGLAPVSRPYMSMAVASSLLLISLKVLR